MAVAPFKSGGHDFLQVCVRCCCNLQ